MFGRASSAICLSALALAIGYAVLTNELGPWSHSLLILGLTAMFCWIQPSRDKLSSSLSRAAIWAAVLFPVYVAFQLLPLPTFLLRILSPTRAEIAGTLREVMPMPAFSPLSIAPPETWIHLSKIAGYALIFLLIWGVVRRSGKSIWWPVAPLFLLAALEGGLGLTQHFTGAQAVPGSYVNRDHFAGLLEMLLPFPMMYVILAVHRTREQAGSSISAALKICGVLTISVGTLLAITFSLSKMGFISMLGSFLVMGVVGFGAQLSGWRKWTAIGGLMLALLIVFVFLPPNELVEGFGYAVSTGTGEGRFPIWKDTLHLIAAYPLFGCGLGGYFAAFLKYQTTGLANAWPRAHNDFLQLLSELGIVGFLIPATLMVAVFGQAARAAVAAATRELRMLGLACAGGLGAILIHSFGDFNMYVPANAMTLAWIAGIAAALPVGARKEPLLRRAIGSSFFRRFAVVCGCLMSIYAGGWIVFTHSFRNDPRAEAVFCRFGICDSEAALAAQERLHGGNTPSVVPPGELLVYLRRDPAGPYNWCDLGESLQKAGRTAEARYCFSRAIALGPHFPLMLLRAAQFHFEVGEHKTALELMAHAMDDDSAFEPTVFSEYEQRRIAVEEILAYGLPDRHAFQRYLRLQLEEGNRQSAGKVWERIVPRGYVDDELAGEYVEFLVGKERAAAAVEAWAAYAGGRSREYPESNRVFNGDFESDPTGCRFDWRINPSRGTAVDFDRNAPYSGARSLRIQFDGTQNLSDAGVWQTVFLKPGRYRFRAYVRTKDVSTDEGISFRLSDEGSAHRLSFTTESMLGSHDWTPVEHAFEAPPGVGLVRVSLVRKPSLKFDCLIRGTLWIDQVSIAPETRAALAAAGRTGERVSQ